MVAVGWVRGPEGLRPELSASTLPAALPSLPSVAVSGERKPRCPPAFCYYGRHRVPLTEAVSGLILKLADGQTSGILKEATSLISGLRGRAAKQRLDRMSCRK